MARDGVAVGKNLAGAVASYVDGKPMNVAVVSADLGVSRKTFYKYVDRFKRDGVNGFFPDSRRPKVCVSVFDTSCEDVLIALRKGQRDSGWDYGADAVLMRLEEHHHLWPAQMPLPSRSTVNRIFEARGFRHILNHDANPPGGRRAGRSPVGGPS